MTAVRFTFSLYALMTKRASGVQGAGLVPAKYSNVVVGIHYSRQNKYRFAKTHNTNAGHHHQQVLAGQ